jgi:hypothetical protein
VKARLQTPIGAGPSTVKLVPARTPEPVGPAAAIGDGSNVPAGDLQRHGEPTPHKAPKSGYEEAPVAFVGEDRRKKDRRNGALPTTLDTRKGGIDRRTKGRISLKV